MSSGRGANVDASYSPVKPESGPSNRGGRSMPDFRQTLRQPKVLGAILVSVVLVITVVVLVACLVPGGGDGDAAGQFDSTRALALRGECSSTGSNNAAKVVAQGHEGFSNRFYRVVVSGMKMPGNVIMSPLSVSSVMAMTSLGARGPTLSELKDAFSLPCDGQTLLDGYKVFVEQLQESKDFALSMANRLYLDESFGVDRDYKSNALSFFKAAPEAVDFSDDATRVSINKWVESQTRNRIKELLVPGSLSDQTKMVLVNAIYFKGQWKDKFDPLLTQKEAFKGLGDEPQQVFLMHKTDGEFRIGSLEDATGVGARIAQLPYVGDRVAMYIILPNQNVSLDEVESKLEKIDLGNPDRYLRKAGPVSLKLPKFKVETTIQLNPVIVQLGAEKLFQPGVADLSGISANDEEDPLYVSDVVQKAFVEVDEEGTEAAAATGVSFRTALIAEPQEFHCDRPFLFTLRDSETGLTLFAGRFTGGEQ